MPKSPTAQERANRRHSGGVVRPKPLASPPALCAPAPEAPAPPSDSPARTLDPKELSDQLAAKIRSEAENIVDGLIASAQGGGYMAAKFLFDFAGIAPAAAAAAGPPVETLLTLLFRDPDEGNDAAGNGGSAQAGVRGVG